MRYLVTGKEMKFLDQNTSDCFKVPELVLMEQAALAFVRELSLLSVGKKGIVFCGTGNNGADGLAIARLLNEQGIQTSVYKVKEIYGWNTDTSDSYKVQDSIYTAYHYPVVTEEKQVYAEEYDFVIDAVFGIGLSRNLNEEYQQVIKLMNSLRAIRIAVDMPSGIHAGNGQVMQEAVKCDYTITFSFAKLGQYLWPGCDYAGKVLVAQMGITQRSWLDKKPSMACLEPVDLQQLPARPMHSNKGTFGKLLIIAGNTHMAGAAVLSAKAAYRSGVGLVKVFTHEENRALIQTAVPEAIVSTYGKNWEEALLVEEINWADSIVIGPGIGNSDTAEKMVELVRKTSAVPVLWDADALNILAKDVNQLLLPHTEFIVTPHLGEFSRLTGNAVPWIQNNLTDSAVDFARTYDVICVLKDFRTVIANPYGMSYLNLSGNNGMATAGSGDVLTGIIGALLAQGLKGIDAAAFGVYMHGLAGDMARAHMGTYAVTASDIIEGMKEVWNKVENK